MLGAQFRGVGVHPLEPPDLRLTPALSFALTPDQLEHGLAWAAEHIGCSFRLDGLRDNALKLLGCPFYLGVRDTFDCSEFVAHALDEAGVDLGELEDCYDTITPNQLAELLASQAGAAT